MRRNRAAAAAFVLLLAWPVLDVPAGGAATSRHRQAPAPRLPIEHATTELVLIDTYITDSHGRAITDLAADDFELVVDGRKSPIASFELREVSRGTAGGETVSLPASAGETAEPASFPRRFILFFEDGASAPMGLTAARKAAARMLDAGFAPTDQVALAAFDTSLRILHDFTSDRAALQRTIDGSLRESRRISDLATEMTTRREELESLLTAYAQPDVNDRLDPMAMSRSMRRGGGGSGGGSAGGMAGGSGNAGGASDPTASARTTDLEQQAQIKMDGKLNQMKFLALSYAAEEAPRLRGVLRAVGALVESLSPWRGTKVLVFMGDGIPDNPALPYAERIIAQHPDPDFLFRCQSFSLLTEIDDLRRAATAAGVTIDTLQTTGLAAGTAAETQEAFRRANALRALSENTGGLVSSTNDFLKALQGFEAGSRAYYLLGYHPDGPPDGRYHSVQVRCLRRDARVRWRQGFTRFSATEARQRTIQAAHLLPDLYADLPLDFNVAPGPATASARIVDLVVHIPAASVLFLPEEGRPTAHLEVGLVAIDGSSREVLRTARTVGVALPAQGPAPAAQGLAAPDGIDLYSRVSLPAQGLTLTAVVYDDAALTVGARRLVLPAMVAQESPILGLSLYSMKRSSLWVEVPPGDASGSAGDQAAGTRIGPALKSTFALGEPLVCGFHRPDRLRDPAAGLRVVIRAGERTVRAVPVEGSAGPAATAKLPLPVEGLPPGDYQVAVQEVLPDRSADLAVVPLRLVAGEGAPAERPAGG